MARAPLRELFLRYFKVFEDFQMDYFAYGGIAVGVWGDPRETQDVDAVTLIGPDQIESLLENLQAVGFRFEPQAAQTFPIDGWLRCQFGGRNADLALGRTPFDQSALLRRCRVTLFGTPIWVASAEDAVLYKLTAYRYKDFADVESILPTTRKARLRVPPPLGHRNRSPHEQI